MPNDFVKLNFRWMPRDILFTPLVKYLLYPSWCDDVVSHATISKKYILAHCENRTQSVKKQETRPESVCYGSFESGHLNYGISELC